MRRHHKIVALVFGVALAQATHARAADVPADIARGKSYAREHCATCHAVGRTGASPYKQAPAFRALTKRYDVAGLAEALAEGIVVANTGTRRMPEFVLSVDEIDDLIAYLKSLDMKDEPFQAAVRQ